MITRETQTQKALVFHIADLRQSSHAAHYELEEAVNLAQALEVDCVHQETITLRTIRAGDFLGGGKIADIHDIVQAHEAHLIIINAALTPIQQRNLERKWHVKVIDRTGLILEIFAQRAATKEGRLQVELARLDYERSRLVRTWTHLERQRGGQGFLAGPGETQIEADRRMLADKIGRLKRDLEQVRRTRGLQRAKRKRAPERIAALVGYTNAGKSSLFNQLTAGGVMAKDMLFATLDTTHRILELPSGKPAVLSDTVGFISDLPTHLIEAFQATLEDVKDADILLHVRDIADPLSEERKTQVLDVLGAIEAGPEHGQTVIEVWNKSDLFGADDFALTQERAAASQELADITSGFLISCQSGQGIEALRLGIETALTESDIILTLSVPPEDFAARAWVHEHGSVLEETVQDTGTYDLKVRLSDIDAGRLRARYPHIAN